MLTNNKIKDILLEVFPDEYLIVGETKVEYLINEKIDFEGRESDSGLNLTFIEYASTISTGILTLKEIYSFWKSLKKDIRKKVSPDEVLKDLQTSEKLTEIQRKVLIQKALELLDEENDENEGN